MVHPPTIFNFLEGAVPVAVQALAACTLLVLVLAWGVRRGLQGEDGIIPAEGFTLRNFLELLLEGIVSLMRQTIGPSWPRYVPLEKPPPTRDTGVAGDAPASSPRIIDVVGAQRAGRAEDLRSRCRLRSWRREWPTTNASGGPRFAPVGRETGAVAVEGTRACDVPTTEVAGLLYSFLRFRDSTDQHLQIATCVALSYSARCLQTDLGRVAKHIFRRMVRLPALFVLQRIKEGQKRRSVVRRKVAVALDRARRFIAVL